MVMFQMRQSPFDDFLHASLATGVPIQHLLAHSLVDLAVLKKRDENEKWSKVS